LRKEYRERMKNHSLQKKKKMRKKKKKAYREIPNWAASEPGVHLFPMVSKPLQSSKLVSKPQIAVQLVPDLGGVAASVKAVVKHTTPARGFLRRGFLNPSIQVNSIPLPKVSVALSSTLIKGKWGGKDSLPFG
jgi:hypothetical protein